MDPYAQQGAARTQWAEQHVKASKNYLKKMTSDTRNIMQISSTRDAGGQINGVSDLDAVFVYINKSVNSTHREKWDADRQISDASKILAASANVRKHFVQRITQIDSSIAFHERTLQGKPILQIGDAAPARMQPFAK